MRNRRQEDEREKILTTFAEMDAAHEYGHHDLSMEQWAAMYDQLEALHERSSVSSLREQLDRIRDRDEQEEPRVSLRRCDLKPKVTARSSGAEEPSFA